ncbi:hypothetical protein Xbud_03330 [Xenorhabdus budapestensis]|uniref:Uncharacterized protein n=1 Tax=Xenorhabdus budapestensis TaxID=290110 RepID=A0A2D0IMT7_XENBU|nr:hypothetical protein Xbud_03657 [Xenorhabdus budapestensis]PHM24335.1 hypothetical protein Xbud_03330 [Xenorhabdus budapestensis]
MISPFSLSCNFRRVGEKALWAFRYTAPPALCTRNLSLSDGGKPTRTFRSAKIIRSCPTLSERDNGIRSHFINSSAFAPTLNSNMLTSPNQIRRQPGRYPLIETRPFSLPKVAAWLPAAVAFRRNSPVPARRDYVRHRLPSVPLSADNVPVPV